MFNTNSNLKQISSLANAKVKTAHNQYVLGQRVKQAKGEICSLRQFASLKGGKVSNMVLSLANDLENRLTEALQGVLQ